MFLRILLISACVISLSSSNLSADAGFKGLGSLSGSDPSGQTYGMSEDGIVVVGASYTDWNDVSKTDDEQAFRWSDSEGMVGLGWLTGHNVSYSDRISGDGLTIIGSGQHRSVDNSDAQFIWTQATGIQALDVAEKVTAISFDGSVLAGETDHATGRNEAFIKSGSTTTRLGFLETPDSGSNSNVGDISRDGSVVVGSSTSAEGGGVYRWTQANGMVALGDALAGSASAVSGAGDIIVGAIRGAYPQRGYIWTESTGATSLFDPGPSWHINVNDISANGTTVVGEMWDSNGYRFGWRWTEAGGKQTITEWLTDAGVDSTGWTFYQAYAVSADGNIVAGYAHNPSGDFEPFIAWVTGGTPKPDLIMGGLGGSFEEPEIP